MPSHRHHGFTLIELVAVIVILGVVTVTAVSVITDLRGDARSNALIHARAQLEAAARAVNARAIVDGTDGEATATVTLNGQSIDIAYGWPVTADAPKMMPVAGYRYVTHWPGEYWFGWSPWDCFASYIWNPVAGGTPTIAAYTSACANPIPSP